MDSGTTNGRLGSRGLTSRQLLIAVGIAAIWLGYVLLVSHSDGILYIVPFLGLLLLASRIITSATLRASTFLALHTFVCVLSAFSLQQRSYGYTAPVQSMPIFFVDLPISFPFSLVQPSPVWFLIYCFVAGGIFWSALGWYIAPRANSEQPARVGVGNRQISLQSLFTSMTIIGIWLVLVISGRPGPGFAVYLAPFFFALYWAYRLILRPVTLAITYFALHAVACAITAALMLQTNDGTEKWVISLPLMILDFPVTFVVAFWEPPGILFPMYVFIAGGVFWAFVGWGLARAREKAEEARFLAGRKPERSLYSEQHLESKLS